MGVIKAREKIILGLKALRIKKNLTIYEVYCDTGIHIGRIESGKRNITIDTLEQILTYYEIDLVEFVKTYC